MLFEQRNNMLIVQFLRCNHGSATLLVNIKKEEEQSQRTRDEDQELYTTRT